MYPVRVLSFAVACLLCGSSSVIAQDKVVRVAVVADGPSVDYAPMVELLRAEIATLFGSDRKLEMDAAPRAGDFTLDGVGGVLQAVYADKQVDAVIGLGVLTASAVAARTTLEHPTLLPFVVEASLNGLPRKGPSSGKHNLVYVSGIAHAEQNLQLLRDMGDAKNVALIIGPLPSAMEQNVRAYVDGPAQKLDMKVTVVAAQVTAAATLSAVPADCDGVLIAQLAQLPEQERALLIAGLRERKLPNVALAGRDWVERGALMSLESPENGSRRARRTALLLSQLLEGKDAAALPVTFEPKQELVVNLAVARAIGVRPTFKVLAEATLIDDTQADAAAALDLQQAMAEAVARNVALERERAVVRAGEKSVDSSRGGLLPRVDLSAGIRTMDPDRTQPGLIPQSRASWGARVQQQLYDESDWQQFKVEQHTQDARVQDFEGSRLDVMLQAGLSYVELLRARTFERIRRENLLRSKKNLDLARVRVAVGTADASEEYRWQAEVADAQRSVVDAAALRSASEIELNRILYRDPELPLDPQELALDERTGLRAGDELLAPFSMDPWALRRLRDFMVAESLAHSPELRAVVASVDAQKRQKSGLKRQLWLPNFYLEGGVDHGFWAAGAGTTPDPDAFGWDVGAYLALPLFAGLSRTAEIGQTGAEIQRLESERLRIEQVLATNTRTVMHLAGAAQTSVGLTREAATAAAKNLELVTDNYQQGTVDIITLIDAQTKSLVSDLAAAAAVYDYMGAMLRVDRSVGYYRFLQGATEQADYAERLKKYFAAHPPQ